MTSCRTAGKIVVNNVLRYTNNGRFEKGNNFMWGKAGNSVQ